MHADGVVTTVVRVAIPGGVPLHQFEARSTAAFVVFSERQRAIAALDLMFSHGGPINGKAGQFAQVSKPVAARAALELVRHL